MDFHLGVFQAVYLFLVFAGLCGEAFLHGKPKTGTHNFWILLASSLIVLGILYLGGFFS